MLYLNLENKKIYSYHIKREERVLRDVPDPRGQYQPIHGAETGERISLDQHGRIVRQVEQPDAGGTGERVRLDAKNFVVAQRNLRHVLEAGEGKRRHDGQRGVLDREVP